MKAITLNMNVHQLIEWLEAYLKTFYAGLASVWREHLSTREDGHYTVNFTAEGLPLMGFSISVLGPRQIKIEPRTDDDYSKVMEALKQEGAKPVEPIDPTDPYQWFTLQDSFGKKGGRWVVTFSRISDATGYAESTLRRNKRPEWRRKGKPKSDDTK